MTIEAIIIIEEIATIITNEILQSKYNIIVILVTTATIVYNINPIKTEINLFIYLQSSDIIEGK